MQPLLLLLISAAV